MSTIDFETPPSASLNRVRIVDLPGLPLEDAVRGKRCDDLLSNRALVAYAREHSSVLGLDLEVFAPEALSLTRGSARLRVRVPEAVSDALTSPEPAARLAAEAIASRLGCNLGWLLITLLRGDSVNRSARPDWSDADWERWARMRHVWLGGGLASGALGRWIELAARAHLADMGFGHLEVGRSPYLDLISVIGAARMFRKYASPGTTATQAKVLGFDFGHTLVKRAVLTYVDGALVKVTVLAPRLVDWQQICPVDEDPVGCGQAVLGFISDLITETAMAKTNATSLALVSVAAYTRNGRLMGNGPYATIHATKPKGAAEALIASAVTDKLGDEFVVGVIHDGTAAALAHAGMADAAVIVMGTALGVGFPPTTEANLAPVLVAVPDEQPEIWAGNASEPLAGSALLASP